MLPTQPSDEISGQEQEHFDRIVLTGLRAWLVAIQVFDAAQKECLVRFSKPGEAQVLFSVEFA